MNNNDSAMKYILGCGMFAISILLVGAIAAWIGKPSKEKLYLYTWADYIDPSYIEAFGASNNCDVIVDTFDCNESAYAKLMVSGCGYDIVFPSSYYIKPFKDAGLLEKLDMEKLPNVVANYDKRFTDTEDALVWYVPYAFSMTGILWRKDKLPNKRFLDWNDMFANPACRVCIFNDIRELLGISLIMNGISVNSTDKTNLDAAVKTARRWKKKSSKMDNESYRTAISSAELHVSMGYSADAIQLMVESPELIGFSIPTNGTTCSLDVFTIMKKSKNKELAYKFINGLYNPETAGKNAEYICAPCTVVGADKWMSEDYKKIEFTTVTDEVLKRCEPIKDIGDNIDMFTKAWDKVKSSNL